VTLFKIVVNVANRCKKESADRQPSATSCLKNLTLDGDGGIITDDDWEKTG